MPLPRLQIPNLGEHYTDLLTIEAWIKDRSVPQEGQSLLCAALQRRKEYRDTIIERLARKRGVTKEALEQDILTGQAEHISTDEFADLVLPND